MVLSAPTLSAVQAEALRAHLKHGHRSLLNPHMPDLFKLAALVEECGEVGRALTYDGDDGRDHLVKELIQVASVALSWVESIEGDAVPPRTAAGDSPLPGDQGGSS
jgi:hypothetical protein